VGEAFKAYKVGQHRHTPEIEQELKLKTEQKGQQVDVLA